jgi:branched-chain amino acid transport system ATP-binding protein
LMARPRVLLLDEPAMGLAPLIVKDLFDFLRSLRDRKGLSIFVVEQNVRAALQIADYGYVMENGRIVLHAPKAELERNEDVREFYLGLSLTQERRSFREIKHYKRRKRWLG